MTRAQLITEAAALRSDCDEIDDEALALLDRVIAGDDHAIREFRQELGREELAADYRAEIRCHYAPADFREPRG
jgi:uncharacterized protein YqeY